MRSLAEALWDLGDVLVVAPRWPQSSMSRAWPRQPGTGTISASGPDRTGRPWFFGIVGSPAEAIANGITRLAPRRPDLCVSGINAGTNLSVALTQSGTVGVCLEAERFGIPGVAVSQELPPYGTDPDSELGDVQVAVGAMLRICQLVLASGLPPGVIMANVNVPHGAHPGTDIVSTNLAAESFWEVTVPVGTDGTSGPCRLAHSEIDPSRYQPGTDVYELYVNRVITVTAMVRPQGVAWPELAQLGRNAGMVAQPG